MQTTSLLFFVSLWLISALKAQPVRFAFVTDTHIGAPVTAVEDLRRTVSDLNALTDIDFVVFTGDVTDFGSDEELRTAKGVLDGLNKKWYIFPGNHDTKWSENGCNSFRKVFGAERFSFTFGNYRFIGCGSGPNMRMSPGLVAREDVLWLRSEVEKLKGSDQPVIFMNHYPLDESLANWYLLIDEIKKTNVQAALCGHGHANRALDFEGIPGTMGRSNLRAKDAVGGYNLVTMRNDTMTFAERTPGRQTGPVWRTVLLKNHHFGQETARSYPRPSYDMNRQYPGVEVVWAKQDSSDVGAGLVESDGFCIYPNTNGQIVALATADGQVRWRFSTGGKVYSTPAVRKNRVVVASTDGTIYCLDKRSGRLLWKQETGRPIVASPLIDGNRVYIGSSEGKFRALSLTDGRVRWTFGGVKGFVESVPVTDRRKVYFGSWGSNLYALDKKTGDTAWTWTNGKSRNFSPAACVPVLSGNRIFIQTPDRTVTAIDAGTGREFWKTSRHKGFESMGVSADRSLIYVKCMQDSLWAIPTASADGEGAWYVNCGFGYEISPGPVTEQDDRIYIPTDEGVLYVVDRRTRRTAWSHKLSNAMVNRVWPLGNGRVLAATMDGKIALIKGI
ncbi:outer membrane protein assembly factor BamB family protein [Larkinella soli]|uniref:outer membrane protein assembly factor BamB family protein n=1 Tax=Larkinella soli TaxID=1770527 RepID=UPI000FFBA8CE|nr:PQQ-binding-like beta-propeller repeat protein [Larkinella soli]